jgi:hypothetical protein
MFHDYDNLLVIISTAKVNIDKNEFIYKADSTSACLPAVNESLWL